MNLYSLSCDQPIDVVSVPVSIGASEKTVHGYRFDLGVGGELVCQTETIQVTDHEHYVVIAFYTSFHYSIKPYIRSGLEIWVNDLHFGYMETTLKDDCWVEKDILTFYRNSSGKLNAEKNTIESYGLIYLKVPVKYLTKGQPAVISLRTKRDAGDPWGYMVVSGEPVAPDTVSQKDLEITYRDDWTENQCQNVYPRIIKPFPDGNREKVSFGGKTYYVYWGDIHCHAKYCDGRRTADDVYLFARNKAKLDFAAITTHDKVGKVFLDPHTWEEIRDRTESHNLPDEFVSILGYEWDAHGNQALGSRIYGHYTVYYFGDGYACFRVDQKEGETIEALWQTFKKHQYKALTIPAHPSNSSLMRCDFDFFDPEFVPAIEIYSLGGSYERYGGEMMNMRSDKVTPPGFYVQDYLKRGYKVGFVGTSDSHNGHIGWDIGSRHSFDTGIVPKDFYRGGLCAVLCESLSRDQIYQALKNRLCYATTGERILIDFTLNDLFMGQERVIETAAYEVNIDVTIRGPGKIDVVELIRNGDIVATYKPGADRETHISYRKLDQIEDRCYYYVKVYHEGGNVAWGSPVYLTRG